MVVLSSYLLVELACERQIEMKQRINSTLFVSIFRSLFPLVDSYQAPLCWRGEFDRVRNGAKARIETGNNGAAGCFDRILIGPRSISPNFLNLLLVAAECRLVSWVSRL